MKYAILVYALLIAGCGLDPISVAKKAAKENSYRSPKNCDQAYTETAYLENHTGQIVNVTMSYPNYNSDSWSTTNSTVAVQISAGGTWNQALTTYTQTNYGTLDADNNAVDAVCSATPQSTLVDLSTLDGNGTVRVCKVKKGVAYLVLPSDTCPAYTSPL